MNRAEDVAEHIYASLVDLRRKVDVEVAMEVARAVADGAARALGTLSDLQQGQDKAQDGSVGATGLETMKH